MLYGTIKDDVLLGKIGRMDSWICGEISVQKTVNCCPPQAPSKIPMGIRLIQLCFGLKTKYAMIPIGSNNA